MGGTESNERPPAHEPASPPSQIAEANDSTQQTESTAADPKKDDKKDKKRKGKNRKSNPAKPILEALSRREPIYFLSTDGTPCVSVKLQPGESPTRETFVIESADFTDYLHGL